MKKIVFTLLIVVNLNRLKQNFIHKSKAVGKLTNRGAKVEVVSHLKHDCHCSALFTRRFFDAQFFLIIRSDHLQLPFTIIESFKRFSEPWWNRRNHSIKNETKKLVVQAINFLFNFCKIYNSMTIICFKNFAIKIVFFWKWRKNYMSIWRKIMFCNWTIRLECEKKKK